MSAIAWFLSDGAAVFIPVAHTPQHYDFLADFGDRVLRIQVKTSTCWRNDRWEVTLCTRGGNQSWNGLVKLLDRTQCDVLFVHVGDGRRWYIPSHSIEAESHLCLGGPKYAEFEVGSGDPLPLREATGSASAG